MKRKKNFSYCLDFSFACGQEGQVKDEEKCMVDRMKEKLLVKASFGVMKYSRIATIKNVWIAPKDFPILFSNCRKRPSSEVQ